MKRTVRESNRSSVERAALRRRIKQFQRRLNDGDAAGCFSLVDPKLTDAGKVSLPVYAAQLKAFKSAYGEIKPLFDRLNVHLKSSKSQSDKRPFAYAYIVWQDGRGGYHLFRERWVKDDGRWYTRVAGLTPNQSQVV